MLFGLVLVAVGLVTKQRKRYWLLAAAAVATQVILGTLLAGGGTLEDPQGDGIITHVVRRATNDGPFMALWGLGVIGLAWGLPIFIVSRGYVRRGREDRPAP